MLSVFGQSKSTSFDLFLMHVTRPGGALVKSEPELFLGTAFGEGFGQISPDGHWMLFSSDKSGRGQIYVTSYPKAGAIISVTSNGGREPMWNPAAPEIVYAKGTAMYAVDVTLGPDFRAGEPRLLFDGPYPDIAGFGYDVAPDGRFLMLENKDFLKPTTTLVVVTNLFDELRRRAPAAKK